MSPVRPLRPLQMQSDARLIELVRAGHERAFDALVRRHRRPLLAYAGRLLGAEGRAEDALQQALLKAWIALRDGAEIDDVRAWLYRIVHNSAVTILRRAQLDCVELNDALDAAAPEPGPESRLVLRETLSSLAALPELQRRAILLTAVSGNSHGEAAEVLGLSDGAVRGLVYRARASIRNAAAGLLPVGAVNWFAGLGQRRSSLAIRIAEFAGASGGAGSAGVAAAMLKGGAIVVSVGALATAGQLAIPYATAPHHTDRASGHSTAQPRAAARQAAVRSSPRASASVSLAAHGRDRVEGRGGRLEPRRGGDRDAGRGAGRGHSDRGRDGPRGSTSGHGSPDGSGGSRASDTSGGSGGTPGAQSSGDSGRNASRGTSHSGGEPSAAGSGAGGGGGLDGGPAGDRAGTSSAGSGTSSGGSGNRGGVPAGAGRSGDGGGNASGSAGQGGDPRNG
jgi:RNA polymerase sigma factor (sigma-70 family)